MIPHAIFYARLQVCQKCKFWDGICLKGHSASSPTGCPIHAFEPIQGAGYDTGVPAKAQEPAAPRKCCSQPSETPVVTWDGMLRQFAGAMVDWIKAGVPLV